MQNAATPYYRALAVLPVVAVMTACSVGPTLDEPVPSGQPAIPDLPPPPVPDVIPGLSDNAEQAAIGTVTPSQSDEPLQSGRILGGVPITRDSIQDPSHPLSKRIVFFDYNSSRLSPESLDLIRGHGEYLSRFGDVRVRVEGHTDERGSREYNIALGDNRARSVARILQLQGVDDGQFSTLSYGEEVPLIENQNEAAWRQNRRVEVVYEGFN